MYSVKTPGPHLTLDQRALYDYWQEFKTEMGQLQEALGPYTLWAGPWGTAFRFEDVAVNLCDASILWDARTPAGELWLMLNIQGDPVRPTDRH